MRSIVIFVLLVSAACAGAESPAGGSTFQAGLYLDAERTTSCITGEAGTAFSYSVWAYIPDDLGLAYITLRFDFPDNLDLSARPVFHRLVRDVIITEYTQDTVEWNMIFDECPSGWVDVLRQECVLLDGEASRIGILAGHSMMRDCTFILNDVVVPDELMINDPNCLLLAGHEPTWGGLKCLYR